MLDRSFFYIYVLKKGDVISQNRHRQIKKLFNSRSIRCCPEGKVEGDDRRGRQDDEGGHHVRGRLHRGGESHDKVAAQQPRPVVRSLFKESPNFHHHRIHEGKQ